MAKRTINILSNKFTPILDVNGNKMGFQISGGKGVYEVPYDIPPTEGKHNYKECKDCLGELTSITKGFNNFYEGKQEGIKAFPYCCSLHEKLLDIPQFKKEDFDKVPEMSARKYIYTKVHIINFIELENWYKLIIDYINYVAESFGQMPTGCGSSLFLSEYYKLLFKFLNVDKELPNVKKEKLIEFLNLNLSPKTRVNTDFNILMATYTKWFKIFPFELSYFRELKPFYEKQFPIFKEGLQANAFSGVFSAEAHTKQSLIEALLSLTNNLLVQINGLKLFESGLLSKADLINLELIISSRKMKLNEGYYNSSPDEEQRYRKILKEWFKDEKEFIKGILPILTNSTAEITESKSTKLKTMLSKHGFFTLSKVKVLSDFNKEILLNLIADSPLSYAIAMLDYLGFVKHLDSEYFKTRYKLTREVSVWFNSDKDGRQIRGYLNSLVTQPDKGRYKAHLHIKQVEKDYQELK